MRERRERALWRPARMSRVEAIVLDRDLHRVLLQLGEWGQAQLIRAAPGPDSAPLPPRDNRAQIERCDALIDRVARLRSQLGIAPSSEADAAEVELETLESELSRWEELAARIVSDRERLAARRDALLADAVRALPCLEAGIAPESIAASEYLHFAIGSVPSPNGRSFDGEAAADFVVMPLGAGGGKQRILAVSSRSRAAQLDQTLSRAGFESELAAPGGCGGLEAWAEQNARRLRELESELEVAGKRLGELSESCAGTLAAVEARARLDRSLLEAESELCRTASTALIAAWVPRTGIPELETLLREATSGRFLLSRSEAVVGADDVPVLLRHSPWIRPYSMLVEAYGTPLYTEIEPTVFMAVSYVLMFGVMFGDVGHGSLLVAAGLGARWFARGLLREAGAVLVFAGASSGFFGALYGSFFGIHAFQKYALWRDPIAGNPMDIMIACIGFGIGLISLGIVLNVVNLVRRGDWAGALLDKFGVAGLLFYWGAIALLLGYGAIASRGLVPVALASLAVPIFAWTCREPVAWLLARRRHEPLHSGLGAAFGESAAEAFEGLLVYLASTISFVRLAAYAMSHAALLLAIFMVSAEVRSIPGGATAVAIAGNAVVIVLEAVIAAVQALRLEYYEFFGKFFSGSGRPFTPFHIPAHGRPAAPAQRP